MLTKDAFYINKIVSIETLNDPRAIQKKAIFLIQVTPNIVALGFSDISLLNKDPHKTTKIIYLPSGGTMSDDKMESLGLISYR